MSGYPLLIEKKVKKKPGRTRISSKHQVTIPVQALRSAGLEPGDILRAQADGAGRVLLTRIDELADRYSGCLDTDGALREQVRGLRSEWR
jgi:bifunctional DNA-binding transcriptional regulator/antitoxin component of YhaV-PrlF toxin-antitoxin module